LSDCQQKFENSSQLFTENKLFCRNMITIQGLNFGFGGRELYSEVSFDIQPGERIGLIGRNGTGKSSLLRLLHGEYEAGNAVNRMRGMRTAFFNQDLLSFKSEASIVEVAVQAFAPLLALRNEYENITSELAEKHDHDTLARHADLLEQLELANAFQLEVRVEKTLRGLGFSATDMQKSFSKFSGGWRMRVMLAKCLLEAPELLMLDEPTNHLDLPAIQWLEGYLRNYEGTVLVVSHDRRFLNQVCNRILEVENQKVTAYKGNYDAYENQKAQRLELEMQQYKNQQKQLAQEMRFIERFRYKASKAKAVQARIKLLDKRDMVQLSESDNRRMNLNLRLAVQPGKIICELKNIHKAYPGIEILNQATALVERGDKIALIGPNGKGKSTLLRILYGTENIEGERIPGHNVKMAFYAQHQLEALELQNNLLEEARRMANDRTDQELRNTLGSFLFSDDDVDKKVKVLSGGEKARLAMAGIMLSEANFLLLDEPTNHLDMEAVDMLIEALEAYTGSFIAVSHDRYFLEEVANKIWYIQDGHIKVYPGNYRAFTEQYGEDFFFLPETKTTPLQAVLTNKNDYEQQKAKRKALNKLQQQLEKTASEISKHEIALKACHEKIAREEIFTDFEALQACQNEVKQHQASLEKLNLQWEQLFIEIELTEVNG
jgi:ATP-binding cassette, subfamily F, member 3